MLFLEIEIGYCVENGFYSTLWFFLENKCLTVNYMKSMYVYIRKPHKILVCMYIYVRKRYKILVCMYVCMYIRKPVVDFILCDKTHILLCIV